MHRKRKRETGLYSHAKQAELNASRKIHYQSYTSAELYTTLENIEMGLANSTKEKQILFYLSVVETIQGILRERLVALAKPPEEKIPCTAALFQPLANTALSAAKPAPLDQNSDNRQKKFFP